MTKLTKDMKHVLAAIQCAVPDLQGRFYTVSQISESIDIDIVDYLAIIDALESMGLIKYADAQESCFSLCEYGRNYKEVRMLESKERWIERLWGFLTGIALTALAWWLTSL